MIRAPMRKNTHPAPSSGVRSASSSQPTVSTAPPAASSWTERYPSPWAATV